MEILILDPLLRGIALGALYALIASGFALILGVMKIINLVQGQFVMLGGYIAFLLYDSFHISPLLSLPVVILGTFLIGALTEQVIDPVAEEETAGVLVTFGLQAVIANLAIIAFSADYRSVPYLTEPYVLFDVYLPGYTALNFLVSGIALAGLYVFLKTTSTGRAIRAVSQNPDLAKACGITIKHTRVISYGIGAALSGIGGALVLISQNIHPQMGGQYLGIMFAVVILGGLGDIVGAYAAGFIIGLISSFAKFYFTSRIAMAIVFLSIPVILLVKPRGLFGRGEY